MRLVRHTAVAAMAAIMLTACGSGQGVTADKDGHKGELDFTLSEGEIDTLIERFDRWVFGGRNEATVFHSAHPHLFVHIDRYYQSDDELTRTLPDLTVLRTLSFTSSRIIMRTNRESAANVRIYFVEEISDGQQILTRDVNKDLRPILEAGFGSGKDLSCLVESKIEGNLIQETVALVRVPREEVRRRYHSLHTAGCVIRAIWKHMGMRSIDAIPDEEVAAGNRYSGGLLDFRPDPQGQLSQGARLEGIAVANHLYRFGLRPGMSRSDALETLRRNIALEMLRRNMMEP